MQPTHYPYKRIIEHLHDGLYFVNRSRIITYWNKAAEFITGFSAKEVLGISCADNILTHIDGEGHNLCEDGCLLARTIIDGQYHESDVYIHHKDGHRIPVSVRVSPLTDNSGNILGAIELFSDTSKVQFTELRVKELEKLSLFDSMTQLPNRRYLESELQSAMSMQQRLEVPFGILFMDIDHFKDFNDIYGHDVGDKVLQFVSNTYLANKRVADIYGRWGGEEFVGIIRYTDNEDIAELGNRMRILVDNSYIMHHDERLHVTLSVGATLATKNDTIESLIKRADELLYQSKSTGRNCLTIA